MGQLTAVLSQGQSKAPEKRGLEEDLVAALVLEKGIEVSVVPHLYDLTEEHTGTLYLRSVPGDLVVLSWIYPRAAHWTLDRAGVRGHFGTVLLETEGDSEFEDETVPDGDGEEAGGIGSGPLPERRIYCIDLRDFDSAEPYLEEIRRIAEESRVQTVPLTGLMQEGNGSSEAAPAASAAQAAAQAQQFLDPAPRRWYPVIDYSRCTNCMECIDFCLFGVYGVDGQDQILVEQQDNCRKGCPACSRVCPENAIIFPQHKTPAIAGAPGEGAGALKIDLSKLFGAPNAIELAAQERDVELVRDGRDAVGLSVGIPKRQSDKPKGPKDELDGLMDALEEIEL
jgi:NAD-dependent dihydropyrimidine dehydrogenase PreA subunit